MEDEKIKGIIEALLFVSDQPLSIEQIKGASGEVDGKRIRSLIYKLRDEYKESNRSFQITEVAEGFQISTSPEYAPLLKKLYKNRHSTRLSHASLETLAIVAYRQPITRSGIESIRGVNVEGVLATLLEKGLLKIVGRKETIGRPLIYGTTKVFLEYFGLNSLKQLPPLKEFQKEDLEEDKFLLETEV